MHSALRLQIAVCMFGLLFAGPVPTAFAVQNNGGGGGKGVITTTTNCGCHGGSGTCTYSQGKSATYCTKDPGDTCTGSCEFISSTTGATGGYPAVQHKP